MLLMILLAFSDSDRWMSVAFGGDVKTCTMFSFDEADPVGASKVEGVR